MKLQKSEIFEHEAHETARRKECVRATDLRQKPLKKLLQKCVIGHEDNGEPVTLQQTP